MFLWAHPRTEHGCRVIYAGFPFFLWFGIGGRPCSNFLASTVKLPQTSLPDSSRGPKGHINTRIPFWLWGPIRGILEVMFCRTLMFVWSFGAPIRQLSSLPVWGLHPFLVSGFLLSSPGLPPAIHPTQKRAQDKLRMSLNEASSGAYLGMGRVA